jgi:hypothetical protein
MAIAGEPLVTRIEELVRRVDSIPDRESRETAQSLMSAILEYHGAALERMMEIVFDTGESGKAAIRRLAGDDLVASLLLLHGLHPDDIETRVQRALGKMHGTAELLGVFEATVRIRLLASGCGFKESVEQAVREAAPDATNIIVEDAAPLNNFVPLTSIGVAVAETV